jgi:FKBP-type peptidyl-prolyl cis-trans isomerase (trigger factor)
VIEIGKNIPDFDNGLVGMAVGETKTIEAIYPKLRRRGDARQARDVSRSASRRSATKRAARAGRRVRAKGAPERPDVEELRAEIRSGLEKAAQEMADDLEARWSARSCKLADHFPDVLLRAEMEDDAASCRSAWSARTRRWSSTCRRSARP